MVRKILLGLAALAAVVGMSGCAKMLEPYQDAPTSGDHDKTPAQTIAFPDGFGNLATKCVDGVRYTVLFHMDSPYGAVSTLIDPACAVAG